MGTQQYITMNVDEKELMKSLRFAFTSKTTIFKEILQNGDRAGATLISIRIEAGPNNTLIAEIKDDGCGIADMSVLLSVAKSGWSKEIKAQRSPYGLGFLSALYATSSVEIESSGFRATFDPQAALAFQPVLVETHPESANCPGTRLVLSGLKLDLGEAMDAIRGFARGFGVRVLLNGEELERNEALDAQDRTFVKTPVGFVSMPSLETGSVNDGCVYYLQGFQVYRAGYHNYMARTVVHLDPTRFTARMPDRDVLIDEHARVKEVDQALRDLWQKTLVRKKAEFPAGEFLERYHSAIRRYQPQLVNDIPLLTRHAVETFVEMPFQRHSWDSFTQNPTAHVTREEVEAGKVRLVSIDEDMGFELAIPAWNYAWKKGALLVDLGHLDEKHWAVPHVALIAAEKTEIEVRGEYGRGRMVGHYVWAEVVLCEDFVIRVRDKDGVEVDSVVVDSDIMFDGNVFLVPRNAEASGWAVNQASDFVDGDYDRYEEEIQESDERTLFRKIQELRGVSPADVLKSLIAEHYWSLESYPSLLGKSFLIEVDAEGWFRITEPRAGSES